MEEKLKIVREILGDYRRSNSEFLFHCPYCQHHKRKMSVNFGLNAWKCWVCDTRGKNIYRLIRKFGTYQQKQKWLELDGRLDLTEFDQMFMEMNNIKEEQTTDLPAEFISLCIKRLPRSSQQAKEYLYSRGLKKEDILLWKIGYCNEGRYGGRLVIPSFNNNGDCNYFISRSYVGHRMKYLNPPVGKDVIFNELYIDWDEPVTLVEGAFDAIVAGHNSIPIMGSTLREESKLFQAIVVHDTPVFLALDADARKKQNYIIRMFRKYDVDMRIIDTDNCDDVGSMSKEEFLRRKDLAIEPDMDEILFLSELRKI
jgi:DNA primase